MKIEVINPFKQHDVVENVVFAYQKVFGGEPWKEGYKCPICEKEVSLIFESKFCPVCQSDEKSILLVESWPKSKVVSDFYREMSKPEALCLVANKRQGVIGFTWGYKINITHETDAYLDAPNIHKLVTGEVFYLDEVAVLPEYQSKGIGKRLVKEIISNQKHKTILLRTLADSPMFYLTKNIGGKVILNISRGRVIMLLDL